MATAGGLRIGITPVGFEQAAAQLRAKQRKVEPVLRGALDTTATDLRRRKYVPPLGSVFKQRSWINKRIIIKRVNARKGRFDARLIPSGSGVEVRSYRNWLWHGVDGVHSKTRARIFVVGLRGKKMAAGFVNPSSSNRTPLRTRSERARNLKRPARAGDNVKSYRYSTLLQEALGPSVAYWFWRLTTPELIAYANRRLNAEFQQRARRELAKSR